MLHLNAIQPTLEVVAVKQPLDLPKTRLSTQWFGRNQRQLSTQIHNTAISADGRIWGTTPSGLFCYDGVKIQIYGMRDGLRSHGLRSLAFDLDDRLWVGSDSGIDMLDITGYSPRVIDSQSLCTVDSICVTNSNGVVIGTPQGLFLTKYKSTPQRMKTQWAAKLAITSTIIDRQGDLWVAGPDIGTAFISQNRWHFVDPVAIESVGRLHVMSHGPNNSILLGGSHGVAIIQKSGLVSHTFCTETPVKAIVWHENLIWAGEGHALRRITADAENLFYLDEIIDEVSVRHLQVDRFGNIWVSTDENSLARISVLSHVYRTPRQANIGAVLAIEPTRLGQIVCGSRGLQLPSGHIAMPGTKIWDCVMDLAGAIWAATEQGLYRIHEGAIPQAYHSDCQTLSSPGRCVIFYKSELYAGTLSGMAKITNQGAHEITTPEGDSLGYVYSFHIGPFGDLWIATLGRGLWKWDGRTLHKISGGSLPELCNVYALTHSKAFDIYVAHDGMISKISPNVPPELFIETDKPVAAWALHSPGIGRLYAGTPNGLEVYDTQARKLIRVLKDSSDTDKWEFTTSRSLKADKGLILCGLSTGLRLIDLDRVDELTDRPSLKIARVTWRQTDSKIKKNIHIVSCGNWRVDIDVGLHWYYDEADCQMQYQLIGFDNDWSELSALGRISYTSLPKGNYVLKSRVFSPIVGYGDVIEMMRIKVVT